MRSPSARVLINTADVYRAMPGQDVDGGPSYNYPPAATHRDCPCSAQPVATEEIIDQGRILRQTQWEVMFDRSVSVGNRDKLVITDPNGRKHTAFVEIKQDQAGRGAAYVVYALEKI